MLRVFANRGYACDRLDEQLFADDGIVFFANIERKMHHKLMRHQDKRLWRHRAIIETLMD